MKKVFTFLAISSLAFVSCEKESEFNNDANKASSVNGIPTEIVCEINETPTKTQYAGDTTFGWTQYDRIKMPVVKKSGGSITDCNFYSFVTMSASGSASATFTITGGSADMEAYNPNPSSADNTWTNMGYLIYPTSIFESEHSGDYPIVNLPATISYNATAPLNSSMDSKGIWQSGGIRVPMIGRKVGDTYKFATAVGILKITIKDFPSSARKVQLLSVANNTAVEFAISESVDDYSGSEVKIAQVTNTSATAGSGTITFDVSGLTSGNTYNFYFPVPVGTYAADDLSVKVKDYEDNDLISMTAKKQVVVARNEILALPDMYPDYVELVISNSYKADNPRIYWNMSKTQDKYGIRLHISTSPTNTPSEYYNGNVYLASAYRTSGFNLTGLKNGSSVAYLSTSGKYFLHYLIVDDTDAAVSSLTTSSSQVKKYGTIPFYFLSDTDKTTYTGNYTKTEGTIYQSDATDTRNALTLSISEDCSKGNIQVGNILGNQGPDNYLYGCLIGDSLTIFKSPDDDTPFFVNNSNYFYFGQTSASIAYETVFNNEINDAVFSLATSPTTLTNTSYLQLYYHKGGKSGEQRRFIQGNSLVYTKNN